MDFWSNTHLLQFANEASVETRLVLPLLAALGYEDSDIESKPPITFQEGRVGRKPEADYLVFHGPLRDRDTSLIVVEAKNPTEPLADAKRQAESYAFNARAPFLLLTNGISLEVWQIQLAMESRRILVSAVTDLKARQGELEGLISKRAAFEYCQSLAYKKIILGTQDFAAYEVAELQRTLAFDRAIERKLATRGSEVTYEFGQLLDAVSAGATIIGPSGFGKTTLSKILLRKAIAARWKASGRLPIDVPLPDLLASGSTIFKFILDRLNPHCPKITEAMLKDVLRNDGLILLFDSFDRLSFENQGTVEAAIRTFARDYPNSQVFVFARAAVCPNLDLPILIIDNLDWPQKVAFAEALHIDRSTLRMMSRTLLDLCSHPLLLRLVLDYRNETGRLPSRLETLFGAWLDVVVKRQEGGPGDAINRERALILFAGMTTEAPITRMRALGLLEENGISTNTYDQLVACDAINTDGSTVEVIHEALADYLRAREMAQGSEAEVLQRLDTVSLEPDSFLPILVMAMLPTRVLQRALWRKLSNVDLDTYVSVLRYRADISQEMTSSSEEVFEYAYLEDLLEGFELPLIGFFPALQATVLEREPLESSMQVGVTGRVSSEGSSLLYGLNSVIAGEPRIKVGQPKSGYKLVNLGASGLRLDSGRLVGLRELKDSLFSALEHRSLFGGKIWAHERLVGRLRYLVRELGLPLNDETSLSRIEEGLLPHIGRWVRTDTFNREGFEIDAVLDDIRTLEANGYIELDFWWQRLGWRGSSETSDEVTILVIKEHFERALSIYSEVVQRSFAGIASTLSFYPSLPVRWIVNLVRKEGVDRVRGPAVYFHWVPVEATKHTEVRVELSDKPLGSHRTKKELTAHFPETRAALMKLGRYSRHTRLWMGSRIPPNMTGYNKTGRFTGETSALEFACEIIKDDLEALFHDVPARDNT